MGIYKALIVTGCMMPNLKQKYLTVTNYDERREQYYESLNYIIDNMNIKKIVFCDGSGYIDNEKAKYFAQKAEDRNKSFEWLCFKQNEEEVINRGKGYGEGEIVDYVLDHSSLMKDEIAFIKLTGRLVVSNANKIIASTDENNNYFICNKYGVKGLDTRLFFCRIDFYNAHLRNLYKVVDDNYKHGRIEDLYFDSLVRMPGIFKGFNCYPLFIGICGGNGCRYNDESSLGSIARSILLRVGFYNKLYIFRAHIFIIVKRIFDSHAIGKSFIDN